MDWSSLLSTYRLGQAANPEPSVRSDFQRDGDRLMFSAAFRRMQDKTQVFPLEKNDYVRTRLTHSLEVSCVGRSLGTSVGAQLVERYPHLRTQGIHAADIGDIVAAACLAHDIGNPPFGHFGEQAMCDYFAQGAGAAILDCLDNAQEREDLRHIEGNAQGFRIVNRLESLDNHGGLRLTAATIASSSKYPSLAGTGSYSKNGCYLDDWQDFCTLFAALGLKRLQDSRWQRHPLSFLMEAADDICYLIVDIEDAYQIGQIDYDIARDKLAPLAGGLVEESRFNAMRSRSDQLAYLRAKAIGQLVHETVDVFWQVESDLLDGSHGTALLESIPSYPALQTLRRFAQEHIYISRPVVEVQIAGHRILTGLMDIFCQTVLHDAQQRAGRRDTMILALLPTRYTRHNASLYQRLLGVCDYISGMTDSYAVSLYKKLTGISLPVN